MRANAVAEGVDVGKAAERIVRFKCAKGDVLSESHVQAPTEGSRKAYNFVVNNRGRKLYENALPRNSDEAVNKEIVRPNFRILTCGPAK